MENRCDVSSVFLTECTKCKTKTEEKVPFGRLYFGGQHCKTYCENCKKDIKKEVIEIKNEQDH